MANGVAQLIYSIGRKRGATPKEIKSALETGIVESHLQNLPGGTGDSAGWRQERRSLYPNPTDLEASINRYFDETRAVRGKYGTAGALAAAVQRPAAQYRGRYQQHSADADALLRSLGGDGSSGGSGSRVGSSPTSVTVTPGTAQNGFDPGPQSVGSLAGLLTQQAPPPVAIPQAPNAVIQSPVVAPPPVRGGLADALAAIQSPAQGLPETQTSSPSVKVTGGGGPTATTASASPSGGRTVKFDGKPVVSWMVPALQYARAHGWKGQVISGVRSHELQSQLYADFKAGRRAGPVAVPGHSNHEIQNGGAVDVSDPYTLARIMAGYKGRKLRQGTAIGDPPHFSATGR